MTAAVLTAAPPPPDDGLPPGQPYVSPDDLASIPPLFAEAAQQVLLPLVAQIWLESAGAVHAQLVDVAGLPGLPAVSSLAAETYLAQAANTFAQVGDDLWATARSELLAGFSAGESIPQLSDRLRNSAGLTARKATLVARTQVLDASNAGSYATAQTSGLELLKGWLDTPDQRTRVTHRAAGAAYGADEQMIPLADQFTVGGYSCDRPHDPTLPPAERYSCRCTVIYSMGAGAVKAAQKAAEPEPVLPNTSGQVEQMPSMVEGRVGGPETALSSQTVMQLRALAKQRGVAGYSKLTKPQLLERLQAAEIPARTVVAPTVRAGIPDITRSAGRPSSAVLTADEQAQAIRLIQRDHQIFATARDRTGLVSTSGNLTQPEVAWLQRVYERDRVFFEQAAQYAQIEENLARAAGKAGEKVGEFKATVGARLKALFDGKPVAVRVRDEAALRDILAGGRFKTQFEGAKRATGLPAASLENRRLGEQIAGVAADAADRPVYGYVAVNDLQPALSAGRKLAGIAEREGQEDILSVYGRIQVVLKPEVRVRTTATVGDSLDEVGLIRPSPVDNPNALSAHAGYSFKLDDLDRLTDPSWTRHSYVEAQVHGGVRVDDIAAVVFPEAPDQAMVAALAQARVPWRVLGRTDPPLRLSDIIAPAPVAQPVPGRLVFGREALTAPKLDLSGVRRVPGVTDAQRRAVDEYLSDAQRINAQIRAGQMSQRVDRTVRQMDGLIAESPLSTDVEVWRGLRSGDMFANAPADLTGFEWTDGAFVSTTANRQVAAEFAGSFGDPAPVIVRVKVPAGTHGITTSDWGTGHAIGGQAEIVLERNLRFRVLKDNGLVTESGIPAKVRLVDVEVVPQRVDVAVERSVQRAAARERNRVIEARAAAERTLAELDDLLVKKASREAFEQRIALAQLDAKDIAALRAAVGDPVKLRATVTRITKKQGITVQAKAGGKVKFDPDLHDPVGEVPAAGTPMVVIRRGSTVTIDGDTIVLNKAIVKLPTAPAKKAAKAAPKKAAAVPEPVEGLPPRVAALPRTAGKPRPPAATAKGTNPKFGSTRGGATYRDAGKAGKAWTPDMGPLPSGAYEENCSNVVHAFEMRMRGFDVQAGPLDVLDKYGYAAGRTYKELDQLVADAWRLADGSPHGRSFSGQQWRSFTQIDDEIDRTWPDGGRGFMFVGKHIFNVVKVRGKVQYIEAQFDANTTRIVTALYKRKYRASGAFSTVEEAKVIRIDDLVPYDDILNTVTPI